MISIQKVCQGPAVRSLMLIFAITCLPQMAAAGSEVPASVEALFPASLEIKTKSWDAIPHEFGVVINGQMHALFPGAVTCDYTIGPEFNLELQGDNAWEASPEQLAMWEQMNTPDFEAEGKSISNFLNVHVKGSILGTPRLEQLPNGHVTYIDFTWKCDKNPGGENVMLKGYARRGTTVLTFNFWANGSSKEAIAMASEIFAKFEKLDLTQLYEPVSGN